MTLSGHERLWIAAVQMLVSPNEFFSTWQSPSI
jgi:hypothetical protein